MGQSARFSLRRLSLRRQQYLFLLSVVVVALAIITAAIGAGSGVAQSFDRNIAGYLAIHDLRTALSRVHGAIEAYIRQGSDQAYAEVDRLAPIVESRWRALQSVRFSDLPSRFELGATAAGLYAYERAALRLIDEYQRGDSQYAFSLAYLVRIRGYLDSYLERLLSIQLDRGQTDLEAAQATQRSIQLAAIAGGVVLGFLFLTATILFSRSVSKPLERLVQEAHALAGGDFDRPALELPDSHDLREVALAFNRMTTSIRTLVRDLQDKHALERRLDQQELQTARMERLVREAQLVALQSQVNPHFLFNTLNSIARTARVEGAVQSENLIRDLSRVLRYILRNPRETVTIAEEIRMVGDYMRIQQVRFGERLRIDIETDPSVDGAVLPPLVLQPIVENAVIHGIEPKEEGGRLSVSTGGGAGGSEAWIRISDDGIGMDEATVAALMHEDTDTPGESTDRIGILNVRARLRLFHGEGHRFSIVSSPGAGTQVEITVPVVER